MRTFFRNPQDKHVGVDLLSAYLDNQVTAAERTRVETHLRECATCQAELNSLRQTVTLLNSLPRVPVPRAFTLSEAQVGMRRPGARPAWLGTALRGLAAVTAVALVAVIATTLLQRPTWRPGTIARVAPQPAAAPAVAATEAPEPVPMQQERPAEAVPAQPEAPVEPTVEATVAVEMEVTPTPQPPTAAPAVVEALPTPSPVPAEAPQEMKALAEQPEEPTMDTTQGEAEMAMAAQAPPPAAPEAGAVAPGRGGGVGGGPPSAGAPEAITPEPAPPSASVKSVLPPKAGVAYADWHTLWLLDAKTGPREVVQAEGVNTPLISDDRDWVTYRLSVGDHSEVWAVRWNGEDARRVLDERELPASAPAEGYGQRRVYALRWVPGKHILAVITLAQGSSPALMPRFELWSLDVESGDLRYVTDMGQADRPIYAPDGRRFALLQHGNEHDPEGSLRLFNADGSGGQVVLTFPAGPGVPVYESQVSWLAGSDGLEVAIPSPAVDSSQPTANITLYRVPVEGDAKAVGTVSAFDTFWSPDGTHLAYTTPAESSNETRQLFLSNADGSSPQLYATPRYGRFIGWSPDSTHFLYSDNQQVYLGAPGQAPQRLGNVLSVVDPRWIAPDQVLHLLDQGTGWMLVSYTVAGQASSLLPLPRDITYDFTRP